MGRGWGTSSLNVLAMQAGLAAIAQDAAFVDAARARNEQGGARLHHAVVRRPRHEATDSQANFMFVDIGRPARAFREACKAKGVLVARDFAPFEKTHCRISYGTMAEMQKAVAVFGSGLAKKATAA